jgi:hypothetical protein
MSLYGLLRRGDAVPHAKALENPLAGRRQGTDSRLERRWASNGLTLSGLPSSSRTSRPLSCNASARALPTIPAPTISRSARISML